MYVYLQEKKAQQLANTTEFPRTMGSSVALRKVKRDGIEVSVLNSSDPRAQREESTAHYFSRGSTKYCSL